MPKASYSSGFAISAGGLFAASMFELDDGFRAGSESRLSYKKTFSSKHLLG